jgi:hypothetical protein
VTRVTLNLINTAKQSVANDLVSKLFHRSLQISQALRQSLGPQFQLTQGTEQF